MTMIRTNIAYALDGMINHTSVDWPPPNKREHIHGIDHVDTCVLVFLTLVLFSPHLLDKRFLNISRNTKYLYVCESFM